MGAVGTDLHAVGVALERGALGRAHLAGGVDQPDPPAVAQGDGADAGVDPRDALGVEPLHRVHRRWSEARHHREHGRHARAELVDQGLHLALEQSGVGGGADPVVLVAHALVEHLPGPDPQQDQVGSLGQADLARLGARAHSGA